MRFYGRTEEIESLLWQLRAAQRSQVARMAVVTGRRRIGKTTLIKKAFEASPCPFVYFFVTGMSTEAEMAESLVAMSAQALNIDYPPALSKLADVVGWLMQLAKKTPLVLVIDECQLLESRAPNFFPELQRTWDLGKSGSQLLLIMSGSVQSTIERIFGSRSEPLFGRADQLMTVQPFDSSLIGRIFEDYHPRPDAKDLLLFYAITGGVARYVELLVDAQALTQKELLAFLYSERGSWLRMEGQMLLVNDFHLSAPLYWRILRKLSAGRSKRTELQDGIDTDISPYLSRLEKLYRIVARVNPFLEDKSSRQTRYAIADPYMRFWLTFLCGDENLAKMELRQWTQMTEYTARHLPTYLGRTLENWMRLRIRESGRWDAVGSWWDRQGENEIDVIALDRTNKNILITEVKTNPEKYDEIRLRLKAQKFFEKRKELSNWSVTYRGLSPDNMFDDF